MSWAIAIVLALLALPALAGTAAAAPGVVQDAAGCRTNELAPNDDDSTDGAVPLGFTAHMFDTSFDTVFVNNNGNVTARDSLSEFTPFDFRETGQTIIAPFFADVDTSGDGSGLVHYGQITYGGRPAFCVIWDHVGYYDAHSDKVDTFQLILVDQGTAGVDVVFNYDTIAWETGDASDGSNGFGGTSAAAGYASGDGDSAHALMLPGSFTAGGLLDSNAATSLAGHSTAGQPAGRWVFQLRQGPPTGGRLIGLVTTPDGGPAGGAPVQICPSGGGACVTRQAGDDGRYAASNLPAGGYSVTAFPGPGPAYGSVTHSGVPVGGPGTTRTEDLELGPAPPPPPDGTTITSIDTNEDGIPVAYWEDDLQLTTRGCPGATATYSLALEGHVVRTGSLTEAPAGSGVYTTTIAALAPRHGDGEVTIHLSCPGGSTEDVDFGIYIDPSGVVRDTDGHPVAGAVVTLLRSATPGGPFFPVADGSVLMSPANRVNPDTTRADGRFGWDVVAGYYVVTATKAGCVAASTRVLAIPPPVTNLDLRLDCSPSSPRTPPTSTPITTPAAPVAVVPPPEKARKLIRIRSVRLHDGRQLRIKLTCAKAARKSCAGRVTARIGKRVVAAKRYKRVKHGKSVTLKAALSAKGRALVKKVRPGKKVAFRVVCTVKDAAGKGATAKRTVSVRV